MVYFISRPVISIAVQNNVLHLLNNIHKFVWSNQEITTGMLIGVQK